MRSPDIGFVSLISVTAVAENFVCTHLITSSGELRRNPDTRKRLLSTFSTTARCHFWNCRVYFRSYVCSIFALHPRKSFHIKFRYLKSHCESTCIYGRPRTVNVVHCKQLVGADIIVTLGKIVKFAAVIVKYSFQSLPLKFKEVW